MLLRVGAFVGLAVFAAGCAKRIPPSPEALQLAEQCGDALKAGELEDARLFCQAATAQAPELARAWQDLGVVLLSLGKVEEAKAPLEKARALDDALWRAHNGLGILAFTVNDHPRADGHFKRATELERNASQPRFNRAWNFFRWRKFREAKDELRALMRLHPDAGYAAQFFGIILLTEERPAEAVEAMLQAIESEPRECRNWLAMGNAYARERRHEEAETALATCVEICPRDATCGAALESAPNRIDFPLADPRDLIP